MLCTKFIVAFVLNDISAKLLKPSRNENNNIYEHCGLVTLSSKIIRIENYRKQSKFFKIIITAIETLVYAFRKYINLFYVKNENYLYFAFYVKIKIIYLFFACILDTKFYS